MDSVAAVHVVFEAVKQEAARLGVGIHSSEIVGLIPRRALENSESWLPTGGMDG